MTEQDHRRGDVKDRARAHLVVYFTESELEHLIAAGFQPTGEVESFIRRLFSIGVQIEVYGACGSPQFLIARDLGKFMASNINDIIKPIVKRLANDDESMEYILSHGQAGTLREAILHDAQADTELQPGRYRADGQSS